MFYAYIVLDPRKQSSYVEFQFQPVYVGKGNETRTDGITYFLNGKTDVYAGKRMNNWLKKMRSEGYRNLPLVKFEFETEQEAFIKEKELTLRFGLLVEGGLLLNSRHGGDGGYKLTEEAKQHLSRINTGSGNSNWGTTWSEERRSKWQSTWLSKDRSRTSEDMQKTWAAVRRKYEIRSTSGEIFIVDDLTAFCKNQNLPLSAFRWALKHPENKVVSGARKKSKVEGWVIYYLE